jgi:hypothetical protein
MKAITHDAKGNLIGHVEYTPVQEMIVRWTWYFILTAGILFFLAVGIGVWVG